MFYRKTTVRWEKSSVASKAARCRIAARGGDLIDFAACRTHGLEAAMAVARAACLAVATRRVH